MRKMLFAISQISAISLAFLILISAAPGVNAQAPPVPVNVQLFFPQLDFNPSASDFHLHVRTKNPMVQIANDAIKIAPFNRLVHTITADGGFSIDASIGAVPLTGMASVSGTVGLLGTTTDCPNQLNITFWWTNGPGNDGPEHNAAVWGVGFGQRSPNIPTQFCHLFNITNPDKAKNLTIVNLAFLPTMNVYDNLTTIVFPPPYYNITILPLQSWLININTTGPFDGGHIYFRYNVTISGTVSGSGALQSTASDPEYYMQEWFDHLVTEPHALIISAPQPNPNAGNTNPLPGTYVYTYGTVVSITATPADGYRFSYWLLDGSNVGNINPISVTMNTNHTLLAVFARIVGGVAVPIDKLGLLAPYIGVASTIIVAIVALTIYVRHVKHRKEKQ